MESEKERGAFNLFNCVIAKMPAKKIPINKWVAVSLSAKIGRRTIRGVFIFYNESIKIK